MQVQLILTLASFSFYWQTRLLAQVSLHPKKLSDLHTVHLKTKESCQFLIFVVQRMTTNLHSTMSELFALMLHAQSTWMDHTSSIRFRMMYSQLRQRWWMSHSDRINDATHTVSVLQQPKLSVLACHVSYVTANGMSGRRQCQAPATGIPQSVLAQSPGWPQCTQQEWSIKNVKKIFIKAIFSFGVWQPGLVKVQRKLSFAKALLLFVTSGNCHLLGLSHDCQDMNRFFNIMSLLNY